MLPGFRFLFAAIVLSMSVMVFGLGAASLFRAAHEKFASMPSRQGPPVTVFALQTEAAPPALAMLRVEPSVAEKPADNIVPPAPGTPATIAIPAKAETSAAPQPEGPPAASATAKSEIAKAEIAKPEIAKSEVAVTDSSPPDQPAPAQASAPAPTPAPADEPKVAATEPAALPPADQPAPVTSEPVASEPVVTKPAASEAMVSAPVTSEQASQPALPEAAPAPTTIDPKVTAKIATLGGPPVAIEPEPRVKVDDDDEEDNVVRKHMRARRASHHRHVAARTRLARQRPQPAQQQPALGFAQPAVAVGSR